MKTLFSRVRVDRRKRNFPKQYQFHSTPRNIRNLFKMADRRFPFFSFDTYASSMRSFRFQIDSSYTCGRAKTMRKRYEWTRIFLKMEKKSCVFKRIRTRKPLAFKNANFLTCNTVPFIYSSLPQAVLLPFMLVFTSPFNWTINCFSLVCPIGHISR